MICMNFRNILLKAKEGKYAIPQFNINNLEWAKYILEECEKEKSPVFLGVSTGAAKYMGGYNTVVSLVKGLIKDLNISIPVMIHLDHASTKEDCIKAIDAGFDSIMIDASSLSLNDNISLTNEVKNYSKNQLIEAELGKIGGTEDGLTSDIYYTNTNEAVTFVSETNIDMLAPALGSVHGIYKGEPNINFDVMREISTKTNLPLVLHGGSGLSTEILKNAIACGIVKINFNTELQIAWHKSVIDFINNNKEAYDPRKVISAGEKSLKKVVSEYISILGSKNKG
ncbi:MAG: class II fructose-bisphosphate aldolase [Bacilli bacterium]|nr:class II fructose-bisphosphate aldolase [Bacilli bacterium]